MLIIALRAADPDMSNGKYKIGTVFGTHLFFYTVTGCRTFGVSSKDRQVAYIQEETFKETS